MRIHAQPSDGLRREGLRRLPLLLPLLAAFGLAACGDAERETQPTSIDPGDRFGEVVPAKVLDLGARTLDHRAVELSWTEVTDGKGGPAQYQVRVVEGEGGWEQGSMVNTGACAYPVDGSTVGASSACIVSGLEAGRDYRFLIGAERRDATGTVRGEPSSAAAARTRDDPLEGIPSFVQVMAGEAQSGTVGQALQEEVLVELKDAAGDPMQGIYVVWAEGEGGGRAAAPLSVTNQFGIARTVWTLGPRSGQQTLGVRVAGHDDIVLSADAAPGPVDRLDIVLDTVELSVGDEYRLTVQGWDEFGNLVETFPVEWESSDADVANVDPNGVVRVGERGWVRIRSSTRDQWRKRKKRDSTTVVVETNPAPVTDLVITDAGESWLAVEFTEVDDGSGDPAEYEVRLSDAGGDWDGAEVLDTGSCASPLTGVAIGGRLACSVDGLADGTDYRVFVRPFRKHKGKPLYALEVAQADRSTLEAPSVPAGVTPESGSNQAGTVGAPLPAPVVVRVTDDAGNPVAGARVTFSPSHGGSTSSATAQTDGNGRAAVQWTLGSRAGTQTLQTSVETPSGAPASGPSAAFAPAGPLVTIPATAMAGPAQSVTVTPASLTLDEGATATLTVQATDAWGNPTSVIGTEWSADDAGVATVGSGGSLVAVGAGSTTVRASVSGVEGTADVTVNTPAPPETADPAQIVDLRVIEVGNTEVVVEFTEVDDGTGNAAWTELRYALSPMGWGWGSAQVLSAGACASPIAGGTVGATRTCEINGLQPGTAYDLQMVAWRVEDGNHVYSELSNQVTAQTTGSVTPPPPAVTAVQVSPGSVSLDGVGATAQLYAVAYDASNSAVSTPIDWTSSDPSVATVGSDGVVTAVGAGTATLQATALCCAVSGTSSVTVTVTQAPPPPPPTVTSVVVSPATVSFDQIGQTLQLTAVAYDGSGNQVSTAITWSSSDPAIATVSGSGVVTARAVGVAAITALASCCSEAGTSQITVTQQTPPPPPPPPSGVWVAQDWQYADRASMLSQSDLSNGGTGPAGSGSTSRPVVLPQPGPWGGSYALENHYGTIPADAQPQVGTHWALPDGAREIWIETWIRFAPEWEIGPDNPRYPNNVDHKTIFIWEGDGSAIWPQRWEVKFGPNWDSCVASAASHDVSYQYLFDPPIVNQDWHTVNARRQQDPTSECSASRDVWDGQWHNFRLHLRMGTGDGQMRVWWDGVKMIDMGGQLDTRSGNRWFDTITFGGNRNQGTNHPMSFFYGPAQIYQSDPGWQ
jgi:uncharacterized protein YjdB